MVLDGFERKNVPLTILEEDEVKEIHKSSLEVLEDHGVKVEHERALELFKDKGCEVNFKDQMVKIPPELVKECLEKAPKKFRVNARDSKYDLEIGEDRVYFSTFPGKEILDLETWETREATKEEFYDGVKVLDALENLHFLGAYSPYYGYKEVPPMMKELVSTAGKIKNSTKFQLVGSSKGIEDFQIKMAKTIGADIMSNCLSASSPLTFYKENIEATFKFIENDLPVHAISGGAMGGTAPASIVGALVSGNVEVILGVVLTQLINPGSRVVVSDLVHPQNMSTGALAFGQIGVALHQVIFNQLWKMYEVPILSNCGASNSKKIDIQCGYEKAMNGVLAAISGGNIIALHGGVHGELSFHPLQAIIDDDIAGMIGRFVEGVEVSEESLAVDLIKEVGPIPGTYLNKKHTRKWWKKEQFIPKAADRLTYPEWLEKEKKSALGYAKERKDEILEKYEPKPLKDDEEKEIEKIMSEARSCYQKGGC